MKSKFRNTQLKKVSNIQYNVVNKESSYKALKSHHKGILIVETVVYTVHCTLYSAQLLQYQYDFTIHEIGW